MTIEETIQALEMDNALALFDPMTGDVYSYESLNELNKLHYDANLIAISALREKAERDKGCMRCNHGKGFYTGNAWIYIGSDGSLSITTSQETIVDFPKNTISRCPWCGRKLKEVQA